jgi:hypothetical protein
MAYSSISEGAQGHKVTFGEGDVRLFGSLYRRDFDVAEFRDSLIPETAADSLALAAGLLKRNGTLTVTAPRTQWESARLKATIEQAGFLVTNMTGDAGSTTVTATPHIRVEEIKIYSPPGVGDILWGMNKLRAIRKREAPCKIHYVICANGLGNDRSKDFLLNSSLVDSCSVEVEPLPRGPFCPDPSRPIYNVFANPWVDHGKPVDQWIPEFPCNFDVGWELPASIDEQVKARFKDRKYVTVYFASNAWNDECTAGQAWQPKEWAETCIFLNSLGVKPVVLGKGWDSSYIDRVAEQILLLGKQPGDVWIRMDDRTPFLLAMGLMKNAQMTVGAGSSGLTIAAAYFGYKVLTFWPKPGVLPIEPHLCSLIKDGFSTKWMPPDVMARGNYTAFHFGEYTINDVFEHIKKVLTRTENNKLAEQHGARRV